MGRIYSVPFAAATVTSAGGNTDLWELTPADDKPIKLRGFRLSQISEVGDAAEEGLDIAVMRLPATVTSGNGGAVTPVALDSADAAAGFAAETNGPTVATTSSTAVVMDEFGWNNRNSPLEIWYPDVQFCPKVKQAEAMVIRMNTSLADDMTFSGCAFVEEE